MTAWAQRRLVMVGALLLAAASAEAQPVIPPGQEARVLELLEPHGIGSSPVDGWRLDGVTIERSFIQLTVARGDANATLRLHHPDAFEGDEQTTSFALERLGDTPAALDPWVAAIRMNDDGEFWEGLPTFRLDRQSASDAEVPEWDGGGSFVDGTALATTTGAFLVVFFLWFWERRRFGPDALPAVHESESSLRARGLLALGLAGGAAAALWLTASAPPLHPDTNRDLLLARDCLESGICLGPSTSFDGLQQHGGWTRLLASFRALGSSPVGAHRSLIVLNALGAGVLGFVAAARLSVPVAAGAAAVAFSWSMWAAGFPILWNPSLAPLAYALLFAGALERRWVVAGVVSGLGAVGAVETHVAGLIALAVIVLALRTFADRPLRAVLIALSVFCGVELALSAPAILMNLESPIARRAVVPALVLGLGVSWLLGGLVRRRVRPSRRLVVVLALCAVGTTGPPLLAALAAGHFLTARYFAVAIVPVVGIGAGALAWMVASDRCSLRVLAFGLGIGALGLSLSPWDEAADRQYYDLAEVDAIADALNVAEGYPAVRLGLRGPLTGLLGEGLAAWAPDASFEPPTELMTTRLVRLDDPSDLPTGWRAVPLPSGAVAGVSRLRSWLRPERAEVCLSGPDGPPKCLTLTPAMWQSFGGERAGYERLASGLLPAAEALRERVAVDGWHQPTLFLRIPIVTDATDSERAFQLFDDLGENGGWRVARVEGVAHRGELGGRQVVLVGGGEGTLTLEHTRPVAHFVPLLILDALELRPAESALRDILCASFPGCG